MVDVLDRGSTATRAAPASEKRKLRVDERDASAAPTGRCGRPLETARRGGRAHNAARVAFVRTMLQHLVDLYANATGHSPDDVDRADVEESLRDSRDVRRELNLAWPPLAAEQVLADLFASPERLFAATPGWSNDDRALLLRGREDGGRLPTWRSWTRWPS